MRIKFTDLAIERLRRNGRGQGEGPSYTPFITIRDISSRGRSRRVAGQKTGRLHHVFSDIEHDFLLGLEWDLRVIDIREQFPLFDRDATMEIAKQMGVRYPYYSYSNVPLVITVDFMVTAYGRNGRTTVAFDTKTESDARQPRTLEKLEIARRYLASQGIAHHVVLDKQIDKTLARNVEWARGGETTKWEAHPYPGYVDDMTYALTSFLASSIEFDNRPLHQVCGQFDFQKQVEPGTGLRFARLLLNRRILETDMRVPNLHARPLNCFTLPAQAELRYAS